jgi:hypothetical protein
VYIQVEMQPNRLVKRENFSMLQTYRNAGFIEAGDFVKFSQSVAAKCGYSNGVVTYCSRIRNKVCIELGDSETYIEVSPCSLTLISRRIKMP